MSSVLAQDCQDISQLKSPIPRRASLTSAPTMAEREFREDIQYSTVSDCLSVLDVINVMRERAARGEPMPVYRPPAKTPSRKSTTMSTSGSVIPSNASTTSLPLATTEIEDELVRIDSSPETGAVGTSTSKNGSGTRKVDWGGMRDQALAHAQAGTQWWQTGKDLWRGEKKVQFSWKGVREDWENVSPFFKLCLGFLSLNSYRRWRSLP